MLSNKDSKSKNSSNRQLRIGESIRHVLSKIFINESFYNTVLENESITVSEVRVSSDLKNAKVFVTPLGRSPDSDFINALEKQRNKIRYMLANNINLKFCPDIKFYPDNSFEYSDNIEKLLSDASN